MMPRQPDQPEPSPLPPVELSHTLRLIVWCSLLGIGVGGLILITLQAPRGATDFCQDYASAVSLLHGQNSYRPVYCNAAYRLLPGHIEYNSHPPTSILLLAPLGLLPQLAATLLWGLLSLAAYLVSAWLLLRAVKWPLLPGLALFAMGSVFWLPGAQAAQWLNTERVLLLLLVGTWLLAERRQETGAGVLLGIACLLKLWPVLFLLVPLLQRRWRLVAVTGVVVAAGTALALLLEGPSAFLAYLGPVRMAEEAWVTLDYPANVSLTGAVVGLLEGYNGVSVSPPLLLQGIPPATAAALGGISGRCPFGSGTGAAVVEPALPGG